MESTDRCVHPEVLPGHPQRNPQAVDNCPTCSARRKVKILSDPLKERLAEDLETTVEHLDPKDVMRFDREAYDALYTHP